MAIYDNNGSTNAEIGKLYDNNGTTSNQIGKVYDNNGTTDSLIYTAWNGEIYVNGDEFTSDTGGIGYTAQTGTVTKNSDNIVIKTGTGSGSKFDMIYSKNPIDLTNFSKLTVNSNYITSMSSGGRYATVGVRTSLPTTFSEFAYNPNNAGENGYTVDVSALKGKYYIYVGAGTNNASNSVYMNLKITSLKLT